MANGVNVCVGQDVTLLVRYGNDDIEALRRRDENCWIGTML